MSFTIYYTSTRLVTAEEAATIRAAAQKECEEFSWLSCEPLSFFSDLQDGKLLGGSKPNFRPHREDRRAAENSNLPDGKPSDLLNILARISRDHKVDWDLMHDYGTIGSVRGGIVDSQTLAHIKVIAKPWWRFW